MVKEKIIEYVNGKYKSVVLNTYECWSYFIVKYKQNLDDGEEITSQGFIIAGNDFKPLNKVYYTLDECLLECICCKHEKCSMSHATEYIIKMLGVR